MTAGGAGTSGGADTRSVAFLDSLRVGDMLAEGGEGRVFELPLQPHLVYKQYRKPASRTFLDSLVAWPADELADADMSLRVRASSAWPESVVVDADGAPTGLLLPRAPRRFALRHRDGTTRLSSLSYLTADPAHRAVAYGLDLPGRCGPERLGLLYALARLIEAFEAGDPCVGHGDLSTKNVLWSLQRGPEVFVIDCDNCERFDSDGRPVGDPARRRAMTPNWDDPAVAGGSNPSAYSDRYSLALIFLRVVGAANFPVQARQREGGVVTVDFPVPSSAFSDGVLGPSSPVWSLCERGLSLAAPECRPAASEWVAAIESVLGAAGSGQVTTSVCTAQGGGRPGRELGMLRADCDGERDVVIHPLRRDSTSDVKWTRLHAAPPPSAPWLKPYVVTGATSAPGVPLASRSDNPIMPQIWHHVRSGFVWWLRLHLRALGRLTSPSRGAGRLRAFGVCVAVDIAVGIVGLVIAAMIAAPILGI